MKIHLDNLFRVSQEHGMSREEFNGVGALIKERLAGIKRHNQGFYTVIDDENMVAEIEEFTAKSAGKYDTIVVLGIGGSAQGIVCLQQALLHAHRNGSVDGKKPKLFVINNIDPIMIKEVEEVLDLSRTLFLVISKSGTTPEPMICYLYFRKLLGDQNLKVENHFVFVTSSQSGALSEIAKKENIRCFPHPENVGGRFSVLSVVGLLPACLVGINIRELLAGARLMRDKFLSDDFNDNLPYQLAVVQYLLYRKGKAINTIMPYSSKLEKFGEWLMQLLAESIGKAKNNYGEIINVGITPTKALGTTDQHIQTQLFNEGPNNRLLMIIEVKEQKPEIIIPSVHADIDEFLIYYGVSMKKIYDIEREANVEVFTKNNRPNITITIDRVDEAALGKLFLLFEGATAFLGEFFEINAFDQPGVELSKVLTKEALVKLKNL